MSTDSVFAIKTDVFEGPLELLIELVEKRKLLINDISLAEVTDEYMAEVALLQEERLPNTAQFIVLAATLLLIKSKSLLPALELSAEEEEGIEELQKRLARYQLYREIAFTILDHFGKHIAHSRQFIPKTKPVFLPDTFTTLPTLHTAMRELVTNLPVHTPTPKVRVKPMISLEEMVARLEDRIQKAHRTTLRELTETDGEAKIVIIGFLAILESVKQGQILVAQTARFQDIEVSSERLNTPQYF